MIDGDNSLHIYELVFVLISIYIQTEAADTEREEEEDEEDEEEEDPPAGL